MSKVKNPQEKKALSLTHDRRNTFGENDKASRKLIPRRKQAQHQAERAKAKQLAERITSTDEELIEHAEGMISTETRRSRLGGFWKRPDRPLEEFLRSPWRVRNRSAQD